ncbi:unnamed protein product [Blepharisma stoltei]|uniref:C2H2-type domain-containing protein n=1 Tax=Blepharisma stoltei TaxID=1481888 RepID=A0AAU9JGT9_9CILI|nr:unnamed protein product [Blepharisma stoltei]
MSATLIPKFQCIASPQHSEYCCELCGVGFDSPHQFRDHLIQDFELDHDSISFLQFRLGLDYETKYSPKSLETPKSPYSCSTVESECDEVECPTCGKFYKNHKGLQQHIGKAHSNKEKGVICSICHKTFKHQHALTFHDRQVHQKVTRVNCEICGLTVYNKYMLTKHISKHPS